MTRVYVFSGPYEHWQYAIEHSVWGVRKDSPHMKALWDRIEVGDKAILYCTVQSVIIGTANVVGKRKKTEPWWEEEVTLGHNIYKYVIDLADVKLAVEANSPRDSWSENGLSDISRFGMNRAYIRKGVNPVRTRATEILAAVSHELEGLHAPTPPKSSPEPNHDRIRDIVVHCGALQGLPSEKEYPIDSKRLDAVWKRIPQGNPVYVFEVQIGGDFFAALAKLKHAWDVWNAKPVLVTTSKYANDATNWLSGSFHEMIHVCAVVDWRDMVKLHGILVNLDEVRKRMGI